MSYTAAAKDVVDTIATIKGLFGGPSTAEKVSLANYELNVRQMQNQAALIAESMRRSTAGTSDSEGNTTSYDPGSNTWNSQLGPGAERVQRSSDNATTLRNTVDLPNAQRANENSHLLSAIAQRAAIPAQAAVANFQPRSPDREFADTQLLAQGANNDAMRPVLQDTLRSFARTGTSAGPVIDAMGRSSADSMRKATLEARSGANAGASGYNQAMLGALGGKLSALSGGSKPQMDYPNAAVQNPNGGMAAAMAQRAAGSADAAGKGAAYGAYGQNATNTAAQLVTSMRRPDPIPNAIASIGRAGASYIDPIIKAIQGYMNPGATGDTPSPTYETQTYKY